MSYGVMQKRVKKYSRMNASNRTAGAKRKWKNYGAHTFKKKSRICDQAINYYARTIPVNQSVIQK
jgi:hypothetical protein